MYNRNTVSFLDAKYVAQQRAIKEACAELALEPFYPSYHAKKNDNNTVMIYTQFAASYNRDLDREERELGYRPAEDSPYICWLENTDINGNFSLDFMNRGTLDLRSMNYKEIIKAFLINQMEVHNVEI
jgi:hypothetical protein